MMNLETRIKITLSAGEFSQLCLIVRALMTQSQENYTYLKLIQNFYKGECDVAKLEALHLKSKADYEKLFLLFHIVCK